MKIRTEPEVGARTSEPDCILRRSDADRTLLNIDNWVDDLGSEIQSMGPHLSGLGLWLLDLPMGVWGCLKYMDIPPGTPRQDVASLLLEQFLERAGRPLETIQRWRDGRGATPLMGRLCARLRVELCSRQMVYELGLRRDLGTKDSQGEALLAERRQTANIPPEVRNLTWRVRKLWYGEWSA